MEIIHNGKNRRSHTGKTRHIQIKRVLEVRNQRKTLQEQERTLWKELLRLQNIDPKEPLYQKPKISLDHIKKLQKIVTHEELS